MPPWAIEFRGAGEVNLGGEVKLMERWSVDELVGEFVSKVQLNIVDGLRDESFDGDDVDALLELVRIELNFENGNILMEEYMTARREWVRTQGWRFMSEEELAKEVV